MDTSFPLKRRGLAVADLQRKLASLDSDIPAIAALRRAQCAPGVPREYDDITREAVKAFQAHHGLPQTNGECDEATWNELNLQAGSVFTEVWQYEMDALRQGAVPDGVAPARDDLYQQAHRGQFAGLAFSGGGIRSATFNLGILQSLAELRLLRNFDYLSTVSGGGYIGAWFSRWLAREDSDIGKLEESLTPGRSGEARREPDEVKFLRQYTNYLTPRRGFFSADTWALIATYVRNATLNMAILVALLAAAMVLPRIFATVIARLDQRPATFLPDWLPQGAMLLPLLAIACVLFAVMMIAANIATRPDPNRRSVLLGQSQGSVVAFIVLPLMLAGLTGSVALWHFRAEIAAAVTNKDPTLGWWIVGTGVAYFVAWCIGWGIAQWRNARAPAPAAGLAAPSERERLRTILVDGFGHLLCAVTALAVGTVAVLATTTWLAGLAQVRTPAEQEIMTVAVVAFGMPLLLSLFGFTMVLCVGLVGTRYSDKSREWWSRQSGWTTIAVGSWVALVAVSLYAPGVLAWINGHLEAWMSALLATTWFGTVAIGLFVGASNTDAAPNGRSRLEWVARLAPAAFSIGLLCVESAILHRLLVGSGAPFAITDQTRLLTVLFGYDRQTLAMQPAMLAGTAVALIVVGLLLAWRVDINKFSLHTMYRNRLVRAYLGASNTARDPHPFTGFDPQDDIQMVRLLKQGRHSNALQRPYHIVNTALNLVKGEELAWQARKAAGFAFTPAFCGFELPRPAAPGGVRLAQEAMRGCFRPATFYTPPGKEMTEEDGGIRLGMAMSVSGAAASPSMGYHSSPPLSFLMTLFNVRLGRWFANPAKLVKRAPLRRQDAGSARAAARAQHAAKASVETNVAAVETRLPPTSPRLGIRYLLSELFGLTDARSNFLYLSDGGHFENLGIYELVRRRCRLIVVVDAGADGQFDFGDLGNAIRKCATDLNIEVEIDVGKIDLVQQNEFSKAHCTTGRIRYDKVDTDGEVGTLLYIKPSLLGTEYADILNYRKTNKGFPHQSTLDQWFDEDQFETYRSLGYSTGKIVLATAVAAAKQKAAAPGQVSDAAMVDIACLCDMLKANWAGALHTEEDKAAARRLYLVTERRNGERRRVPVAATLPPPLTHEQRRTDRRAA